VKPTQPTVEDVHEDVHEDVPEDDPDSDGVPDLTIAPTPVATARRHYGVGGAMLAGGMLGLDQALGLRKPKQEAPIVIAAATDPLDIDDDGIEVPVDEHTSVFAPPQPRSKPHVKPVRGRR